MKGLLTTIFIISFVFSYGQDSLQIHIDTLKIVTDSITRYEGVNGKLYGPRTIYLAKESYKKKEGYNKIFRENGKLYFEGYFKKSENSTFLNDGIFKYYDKDGQLDYTHDFSTNKRIYYFHNETKRSEGYMSVSDYNLKSGIWICYYPGGTIKSTGAIVDGTLKYGVWKYFNKKGELKEEKNYKQYTGIPNKDCCDW